MNLHPMHAVIILLPHTTLSKKWRISKSTFSAGSFLPSRPISVRPRTHILDAELPGFSKEDIHAEVRNGYLTIHAEHKSENEEKDEKNNYIRRERSYGSFSRSFDLEGIKSDEITASYKDGVLSLTLPKEETKQTEGRRLEIQ